MNISNVVSFQVVCPVEKGVTAHLNQGAEFDETTKSLLNQSKEGDIVTFEKIIAVENGKEIKKPGLMYAIVQ